MKLGEQLLSRYRYEDIETPIHVLLENGNFFQTQKEEHFHIHVLTVLAFSSLVQRSFPVPALSRSCMPPIL